MKPNKDRTWIVYAHINKTNGMTYVGITSNIKQRWRIYSYQHCKRFYQALLKYGWDGFKHIILFEDLSVEMACIIEKELIKKFKLQNETIGYNKAEGGIVKPKGGKTKPLYQYNLDGHFIREWPEAKSAAKALQLNYTGLCAAARGDKYYKTNGGFLWSYEKRETIPPYQPIDQHKIHPPIAKFDINGNYICTYNNIWDYDFTEGQVRQIVLCCKKNIKSCYNHIWLWASDVTIDAVNDAVQRYNNRWYGYQDVKKVCQYDLSGNLLNIFESCTEASEVTGINYGTIQSQCPKTSTFHQACGYLWYYYNLTQGENVEPYQSKSGSYPLLHYTLDGKFIKKYKSIHSATLDGYGKVKTIRVKKNYLFDDDIWIPELEFENLREKYHLENPIID